MGKSPKLSQTSFSGLVHFKKMMAFQYLPLLLFCSCPYLEFSLLKKRVHILSAKLGP